MKKITTVECVFLTVNFICIKLFLAAPQLLANIGAQSAWLCVRINMLVMLSAFSLSELLIRKKNADIFSNGSKWIRAVLGYLTAIFFIVSAGFSTMLFIEGVVRSFLPTTPNVYIAAFLIGAALFAAYRGICPCVQISVLITPVTVFLIVFLCLMLMPFYETSNLFPVLGTNDFWGKSVYAFNFFGDFMLFYLISPYLKSARHRRTAGFWIIGITTVLFSLFCILQTLVIPPHIQSLSPFYQMTLLLCGDGILTSVMQIIKYLIIPGFMLYLTTALQFSAQAMNKSFDMNDKRPLLTPIALCMLFITQLPLSGGGTIWAYRLTYNLSLILFPSLVILASLIKRREKHEAISDKPSVSGVDT